MLEAFKWDRDKALINLVKHKVSFSRAATVFHDAFAIEREDLRKDYQEKRFILVGKPEQGPLLCVVYTEREGWIRIISARKARTDERNDYYSENSA